MDAIINHKVLASVLDLVLLFDQHKHNEVDPALAHVVFSIWRDLICTSLVLISRAVGGVNSWMNFLQTGCIAGPLAPPSPEIEPTRIYDSILHILQQVLNEPHASFLHEIHPKSDIMLGALLSLSSLIACSNTAQSALIASPVALSLLSSTGSQFSTTDLQSTEINLAACHLMAYLSFIAPPGGAQKKILIDAAGTNIVALLNHFACTASTRATNSSAAFTHLPSNPFEFALSLVQKRPVAPTPCLNIEDAILKVLCGDQEANTTTAATATAIEMLGETGATVLGLLVGFCDPRVWSLQTALSLPGNEESGDARNDGFGEFDLEMVVSDSEVMSRIRGVAQGLLGAVKSLAQDESLTTQAAAEARAMRTVVLEFLGLMFEVGVGAETEGDKNALSLKRSVCLTVMDQVDGWSVLFGDAFYGTHCGASAAGIKLGVVRFVISVGVLPDTSNAGLVLNLLKLVAEEKWECGVKFVAVRCLSAICQHDRGALERTVESLVKLNFLEHLNPRIVDSSGRWSGAGACVEESDFRKTLLALLNRISRESVAAALHIADHPITRVFLIQCVTRRNLSTASAEILSLGFTTVMTITGTLLSASEKQLLSISSQTGSDAKTTLATWIVDYMSSFPAIISSIPDLNTHLRLLKGLRSVMKLFPSGSLERGRIRSRLVVDSQLLERLVQLFSVPFSDPIAEAETSTHSTPTESTAVASPIASGSPTTPVGGGSISLRESMHRVHAHALMATIGSLLTGSLLANRTFHHLGGFDEIKLRLFVEGGSGGGGSGAEWTLWEGFLNDLVGLLVPKLMAPVVDEFVAGPSSARDRGGAGEDEEVLEISNVLVIRNLSVLEPLVLMFEGCPEGMRLRLLGYLEKLANGHEMNRVLMTQAGAVGMLLKNVLSRVEGVEQLDKFIKVFELVANYSISVAEAKYLFRCFRHFETTHQDASDTQPSLTRSRSLSGLSVVKTPPRTLSRRPSGSLFDGRSNTLCLPFYYDSLIKSVLKLFQRKDPDLDMFYFSGRNSGLVLPEVEKWPSNSGYSFIGWIKIQDYTTNSNAARASFDADASVSVKVIWSMRAENGDGVELLIVKNILTLHVYRGGHVYSLTASEIPLISKRWYFINVSHAGPKFPLYANPEATLYINGVARVIAKLPYPDTRPHAVNRIGATGCHIQLAESPAGGGAGGRKKLIQVSNDSIPDICDALVHDATMADCMASFSGQMTCIYVMDDVLTNAQVESLHEIGPGHCSQFKSEDLASFPDVGKILFDGSLYPRILLQLYPTATRHGNVSSMCYDIGPRHLGDVEMRDVIACSSKCLQTAVHAFGGIEVTFPLLSHINHAIEAIPVKGHRKSTNPLETPAGIKNNRLCAFLQMIALLLSNDIAHMERFAVVQGPRILSMLLQQQDITLLNMKSLDAIMAVVKIASDVSMLSPKIAPTGSVLSCLGEEMEECLVFEYRLWSLTDPAVQLQHVEFLQHFLLANNDTHRSKYGLIFLLEVLEKFYWTTPPDFLPPDLLAKLMLARVDVDSVRKIRLSIFNIMTDLVSKGGGIRPEECHRLVTSLWTSRSDPTHVLELLEFLIDRCLGFASNAVLETFLAHGAPMEVILWLAFHAENEPIRVSALKLILVLLKSSRTPEKYKKKLKLEDFPGNFTQSTPLSHHCGSVLAHNLAPHPMTKHFYLALLQLAVEEQLLDWHTDGSVVNLSDLASLSIVNGVYLAALLELLSKSRYYSPIQSDKIALSALEDILFIVTRSPGNSEQLRKIYGWQTLLVELIPSHAPGSSNNTDPMEGSSVQTNSGAGASAAPLSPVAESPMSELPVSPLLVMSLSSSHDAILDRVVEIFCTSVLDSFVSDRKVWRMVEEMMVLVWISKKVDGLQNGTRIIGAILKGLMRRLRFDIQGGDADMFTGNTLENTYHLLSLVEEFLFSYHDLYDEVMTEVGNYAVSNSTDNLAEPASLIDAIASKLHLSAKPRPSVGIQMAYPFHENRAVAEECVELIGCLLEFGITHVSLADTVDKAHTRSGGIPRMQLRLLLNAISAGSHEVWSTILPHFMALFEKHAQSFCDGQFKNQMANVLSQLTDAYKLSLTRAEELSSAHPTTKAIFPLFILVLQQWQEPIAQLWKATDGTTLSKELLDQTESNLDSFTTLINSSVWSALYEQQFFPGSREAEEEELACIPNLKKRFAKVSKPVIQKAGKDATIVSRMIANLESHLKILHTRRESEVHARFPDALAAQEVEKRLIARRWLAMFHELTQERGIWLPKKFVGAGGGTDQQTLASAAGLKWKLDRTENSMRMHRRLIPNFEFDDHKDASMRRDRSHASREVMSPAATGSLTELEAADPSLVGMTSAERKKAKVDKLKSHYKLGASADELRLVTNSMGALNVTEDDLAEEDWDVVNNEEMAGINVESENFLFSCECEMILLMTAVKGRLELTSGFITFFADIKATAANLTEADQKTLALLAESEVLLRERRWDISKLREIYFRRYKLRNSATEFFFVDGANCFFNFKTSKPKMRLMTCIIRLKPVNLKVADVRNPVEMISKSDVTERWQKHEISNFEYLMQLNCISGRTNNDLTQYPVFPWVLTDYVSETLDLSDSSIYRDLSKPIGALDPARLEQYLQRFESFEDPSGQIKKFMYGTHYSTSAAVLFYMLRMEPFTSLHIALQGGKFDHPDRQFDCMENCWKSVLTGNGDVKELIPEFFYMPEFLVNETGTVLNNVILPPWASTPEEFIRIHREALEGDYVSEHLHEWIDLVWGFKQTGPEAVKAHNVFYYLTYEGAINIDQIQDPVERRSIEDQINNFGQTPMQLFKKPHPQRLPRSEFAKPSVFSAKSLDSGCSLFVRSAVGGSGFMPYISSTSLGGVGSSVAAQKGLKSFMSHAEKEKLITIDSSMVIGIHKWDTDARHNAENLFAFEADCGSLARRRLPCYLASNMTTSQNLFAHTKDGRFLFTCGHWDSSFQVISLDNGINSPPKSIEAVYGHHDIVTCLALAEDGRTLVTGSRDTTVIAWDVSFSAAGGSSASTGGSVYGVSIKQDTRRVFYGHDEEVTCVSISADQDIVVSGSKDGTCIVHALGTAQYLRTIRPQASLTSTLSRFSIGKILITRQGLVVHSEESTSSVSGAEDFSVCSSSSERAVEAAAASASNCGGPLATGVSVKLGNRWPRKSHVDALSVNGKFLKSRQFAGPVGDLVASDDGKHLILALHADAAQTRGSTVAANEASSRAEIVLEKLDAFTLQTVMKQSVDGEKPRAEFGSKADVSLHVTGSQQCLIVGCCCDKVLVLIVN
ncbi:Neurobeachin-like protein 2 [Podochytrium sp. JEL0797]|nr:Neurobeachin-like protein 2 [Podochytrium sp. JEL0797]